MVEATPGQTGAEYDQKTGKWWTNVYDPALEASLRLEKGDFKEPDTPPLEDWMYREAQARKKNKGSRWRWDGVV